MSTDYGLVCHTCKKKIHLGTRYAGRSVLGPVGGVGTDESRERIMEFVIQHTGCGEPAYTLVVMCYTDPNWPDDYEY